MLDEQHIAPFAAGEGAHSHMKNAYQAQPVERMRQGTRDPHILNPFMPKHNPYEHEDPTKWGNNMISCAPCLKVVTGNIYTSNARSYVTAGASDRNQHIYQPNLAPQLMPPVRDYHPSHDPEATIQSKTGGVSKTDTHRKRKDGEMLNRALLCGAIGLFLITIYMFGNK
jgi:hypothetical protein